MEALWEAVKGIGAVVGLLTGAFVVWDRATRHRPFAIITSQPLVPSSVNYRPVLVVDNPSPKPIILKWRNGAEPDVFRIAVADSIRGIVKATVGGRSTLVVDAKSAVELLLLTPPNYSELDPDQIVPFEITWEFAQPEIFKHHRRLKGNISKRNLQALLREDLKGWTRRETDYEDDHA